MSQQQRTITVAYANGLTGRGVATGNNAAWHCDCPMRTQLLGFSDSEGSTSEGTRVVCPNCGRPYRVLAAYPRGRAMAVRAE